ncbi:MAG: MBL fold metallo-hydrolase [Muribaculaceae bacterium]|nr:MBL fold metallo-hydrolase [Muribaculaceae bacterium]
MSSRYNRRSIRPLEDLPSLFGSEEAENFSVSALTGESRRSEPVDDLALAPEFRSGASRLRFMSFGSGSSGNCAYIGTPENGLLIDAGVDNKKVIAELERNGIDIATVHGIFLTHDHGDHVKFAYSILRRNPHMKLFTTLKALEGILRRHNISRRIKDYHSPIYKEHEYTFGDITVTPFETSHDGTDNCGFYIKMGDSSFVVATDMGMITERADHYLRLARSIMIEANYDEHMLTTGRYTEHLKARIRSAIGHMDNSVTARYLTEIFTPALKHIFLCHLSEDNNTPETAMATVINALRNISVSPAVSTAEIPAGTVYLMALPRHATTDLFVL